MDVLLVVLSVLSLVFSHEGGSRYGANQELTLSKSDGDNISQKTTPDFPVSFSLPARESPVSDEQLNKPFISTLYRHVAGTTMSREDFPSQSTEKTYTLFKHSRDSNPKKLPDLTKALTEEPNNFAHPSHTNSRLMIRQTPYSAGRVIRRETPTTVAQSIGVAHSLTKTAPRPFPTTVGTNTRVLGNRLYRIPLQLSTATDNTINSTVNRHTHLIRLTRNPPIGISSSSQASTDNQNMPPMFDYLPVGTPLAHDAKRWGEFTANFITQPLYQSPLPGTPDTPLWMYRVDSIMDMIEPIPGRYRAIQHDNGLIPQDLLPTYPCFLKFRKQKGHCNCGMKLKRRIVGGHFAKEGAHPWMAGFYTTTNPVRFCGGTILDKYWIITAAHCFMKERHLSTLRIGLGDYDVHTIDKYEHVRNVAQIIMHSGFNENTGRNDIALVKVTEPIQFNFAMSPACLPYQFTNCTWIDDSVTVIGWGRTMEGFHHPSVLREATVKVIATQECRKKYKYVEFTNMCAHKEGTDTCQGDSGGPALMSVAGHTYIVGIVSWGVGCARPNKPGIYTSVNYYLDWIDENTGGAQFCHM